MSKSTTPQKNSTASDTVTLQNSQEDTSQEESLEEILLQELLQKTTDLQQADRKLFSTTRDLQINQHIVACQSNGIIFVSDSSCTFSGRVAIFDGR